MRFPAQLPTSFLRGGALRNPWCHAQALTHGFQARPATGRPEGLDTLGLGRKREESTLLPASPGLNTKVPGTDTIQRTTRALEGPRTQNKAQLGDSLTTAGSHRVCSGPQLLPWQKHKDQNPVAHSPYSKSCPHREERSQRNPRWPGSGSEPWERQGGTGAGGIRQAVGGQMRKLSECCQGPSGRKLRGSGHEVCTLLGWHRRPGSPAQRPRAGSSVVGPMTPVPTGCPVWCLSGDVGCK